MEFLNINYFRQFFLYLFSLLVHIGLLSQLSPKQIKHVPSIKKKISFNISLNSYKKHVVIKTKKKKSNRLIFDKQIIETIMKRTKKLKKQSHYLANTQHRTLKETKVAIEKLNTQASFVGKSSLSSRKTSKVPKLPKAKSSSPRVKIKKQPKENGMKLTTELGFSQPHFLSKDRKKRRPYEEFLKDSFSNLQGQINAGYRDYIDRDIEEGEFINLNTSEYRYIHYFSKLRRAIQLVWNYPLAASRRGIQGTVELEFIILPDGRSTRVQLRRSSGFAVLDNEIIKAIQKASPFSPLPKDFPKKTLPIKASFRYLLQKYSSNY